MRTVAILEDGPGVVMRFDMLAAHLRAAGDPLEIWCEDAAWESVVRAADAELGKGTGRCTHIAMLSAAGPAALRSARDLVIA